jgi:two-component system chemotaxis sensor kinase CheA
LSIGQKLALLISGLQLAIVVSLSLYFQSTQIDVLTHNLSSKAATYAQLVSAQVRSAVAFDDKETAREVFDAVSSDPDLMAVVLFDQSGKTLHSWGSPGAVAQRASGGVDARKVFELPDRFLAVAPVQSLEGPRGTLTLELTKAGLVQARAKLQRAGAWIGGLALFIGCALALLIAHSLARRLRTIAVVAERVAAGDLSQKAVTDPARDEVGSLARSFGTMLQQIKRLFDEMRQRAADEQIRLEGLVQQRTTALAQRNGDMRLVLDNVGQGFLTIDRDGKMSGECSAITERWLGRSPASGLLWDYIDQVAPGMRADLEMGWGEVVEGVMPIDVMIDQMPNQFCKDGQYFSTSYKPILGSDGQLERAVVVLSDVTPQVERERAEAEQREALGLFSRVGEDRAGVIEFFAEAKRLVTELTRHTPSDLHITKRLLHTLKGNAALFGMERFSSLCHAIEDTIAESGAAVSPVDLQRLSASWAEIEAQLSRLTGDVNSSDLSISAEEYQELLQALQARKSASEIQTLVEPWKLEATEPRLKRAARQASALAERLGKSPVEVHIESNKLRLDPEQWRGVWAEFPHLIRNAVDHGLHPADATGARAKPNRLILRTFMDVANLVIEVEDTGRGVDWERVRELARARGLASSTPLDLERALLSDGFSTKEQVGETSGRGVGMAAVAAAVQARGGQVRIHSQARQGTRVRLTWPRAAVEAASSAARNGKTASNA